MNRYVVFAIIVIASVFLDQYTKMLAEQNLASRTSRWDHGIERIVDADQNGLTIEEWIGDEFEINVEDPDERRLVRGVYAVDEAGAETGPLNQTYRVTADSTLRIYHREVVVVPGFWNHIYVQNFGAAWGIFSEQNESFRRPFFTVVPILAVLIVLCIFRGLRSDQRMMIVALSLIVSGAIGNFIDRVRYGYVIDFIDWYVTYGGEERHWPTFNIADVAISIGVALMALEIVLTKPEPAPGKEAAETASGGGVAAPSGDDTSRS
jgi:signal peptidase II